MTCDKFKICLCIHLNLAPHFLVSFLFSSKLRMTHTTPSPLKWQLPCERPLRFPSMPTLNPGCSQDLRALVKDFPNPVLAIPSKHSWSLPCSSSFDGSRRCEHNFKRTFLILQIKRSLGNCLILAPKRKNSEPLSDYRGDPRGTVASEFQRLPWPSKGSYLWWKDRNRPVTWHSCFYNGEGTFLRIKKLPGVVDFSPSGLPLPGSPASFPP